MLTAKLTEKYQGLSDLLSKFDWAEIQERVGRESRARIVLLGLPGAGKSTLLNQLCGWTVSTPNVPAAGGGGTTGGIATYDLEDLGDVSSSSSALPPDETSRFSTGEPIEDFGLFCLVDLPQESSEAGSVHLANNFFKSNGYGSETYELKGDMGGMISFGMAGPLELAEGADLLIYVLDGTAGARPADYRWVGRLRRLGIPVLVVLNKSDLIEADLAARRAEIETRLAATVLPVSALTGANVSEGLLPKMMNTCPSLTVALGRELPGFRCQAAQRLIHQTALLNGLVALQPVPLLDLPIQMMTLTGLMLRIGAIYDRPPIDTRRREVLVAIAGGLAGRYGAQQLAKFVPVIGWLISSLIGWSATWALGRAAMTYFEAGGDLAVDRRWGRAKEGAAQVCQKIYHRWQRRPRLRLEWRPPELIENGQEEVEISTQAQA